jgi:hypothetical protein
LVWDDGVVTSACVRSCDMSHGRGGLFANRDGTKKWFETFVMVLRSGHSMR